MDYVYIAAGAILLTVIYYHYLTKNYRYWEKKCVPYLKDTIPGLGNLYPLFFLRKNLFQICHEFHNKMPGCSIVGFYYAREPALLIRDPELVKSVLQTNFMSFRSNGQVINPEIDRLVSRNPFVLEGEQWKAARQQLSSAYTSGKLKYMYESIDTVCTKLVKYLNGKIEKENGEHEIELKELFARYTAEVVASAGFGIEGNSFKDNEVGTFVEIGREIFEPTFPKAVRLLIVQFIPFLAKLFNTAFIPQRVQDVFTKLLKDVVKYRAERNIERPDFLQLMLNLKKSGASDYTLGEKFGDDAILSHTASFFIEGYETSSITMSFVAYELANNPTIQQRLRDEVLTVSGKHNGITYEALQEMTYMDKVVHETLRLHPPGGAFFKVCTDEIELKGSDGITCKVMPGTPVMISIVGLQKDPEYWPDPEKFDPERFSDENKQSRQKFTYLAWGEGPRVCIGMRMAVLQMKAAIATTMKNYSLELSPKTQVPLKMNPYYFMPSAIGGLWVKVKPLQ